MAARVSIFGTLSHDELAGVVRYIGSKTLLPLLLAKECPFAPVVHLLISNLDFGRFVEAHLRFQSATLIVDNRREHIALVKSLLETCKELRFSKVKMLLGQPRKGIETVREQIGIFTHLFASYLSPRCSVTLTIPGQSFDVIGVIDEDLRKHISKVCFTVKSRFDSSSPTGTVTLRNLGLNLKSLSYSGWCISYFDDIWEFLGSTLERVEITSFSSDNTEWVRCIHKLNIHCRKLSAISLRNRKGRMITQEWDYPYVDLLCSYGSQLIDAELHSSLNEESLMRIARECTKLRCSFTAVHPYKFPILQERLKCLILLLDLRRVDATSLSVAMKTCSSLKKLEIKTLSGSFAENSIKALFSGPLHCLESLTIHTKTTRNRVAVFQHIATVTSNLQKLCFRFRGSISLPALADICLANPRLKYIRIYCIDKLQGHEEASFHATKLCFDSFKACADLQRINIEFNLKCSFKQGLLTLCVPYRRRSVSVFIAFSNIYITNGSGEMESHTRSRRL